MQFKIRSLLIFLMSLLALSACGNTSDNDALPQAVIPLPSNQDDGIVISSPSESGFVTISADAEIFPAGMAVLVEVSADDTGLPFLETVTDTSETFIQDCVGSDIPTCPTMNDSGMCQFEGTVEQGFEITVPAILADHIRISYVDWNSCQGGHVADAPVANSDTVIHRDDIIIASSTADGTNDNPGSTAAGTGTPTSQPGPASQPPPVAGEPTPVSPIPPATPLDPLAGLLGQPMAKVYPATVVFQQVLGDGHLVLVLIPNNPLHPELLPLVVIGQKNPRDLQWYIENVEVLFIGEGIYRARIRTAWEGTVAHLILDVKNQNNGMLASFAIPSLLPVYSGP